MSWTRAGVALVHGLWPVAAVLAIWQAWIVLDDVPQIVAPSPEQVLDAIVGDFGTFAGELGSTLGIAALGLAAGMALGLLVALVAWSSRTLGGLVLPASLIVQSVPIVAIVPVIARVLGYDVRSVVAIVVLISFFPTFAFVRSGLLRTPPGSEDLFTVLGASRGARLVQLALPSAIPSLMVAFRLAAANAILAALVAEFLMGTRGLGYLIGLALGNSDLATAWGAAVLATVVSVLAFLGATALERWANARWT